MIATDALLWLMLGGLLVITLTAVGAKALRDFSRFELEEICRRRNALDRFGEILRRHERVAMDVEHLLTLAVAAVVVVGTIWFLETPLLDFEAAWGTMLLGVAVLIVTISAVKIWIPWSVANLWSGPFLFHTWRIWRLVSGLMAPLSWCANVVDAVFHRLAGKVRARPTEDSFEEEIRTIVSEGHREGLLEEDAREMIEGVIELRDADVAEIMTPRTDTHTMHVGLSWDEMLKEIIRLGHTRIPVYDKNRDDIIGILHSKDLLPLLANGSVQPPPPLRELLRKPYFVPESKPVADLLQVFQQTRNHIAVVLDEYGGVSGLVTIEDVLEEIVGEIVDEYDEEIVEEIHKIDERTCEALGRAHVDEINEEMGFSLPEDGEYDTIAGFVFTELGHIPLPGESIVWSDQMRITVLEATRRRIDRVRLELVGESTREIA
ncbi:MAG: hemolysin family protein [Pirellulales bacterium]